jgi:hypothetical protein
MPTAQKSQYPFHISFIYFDLQKFKIYLFILINSLILVLKDLMPLCEHYKDVNSFAKRQFKLLYFFYHS